MLTAARLRIISLSPFFSHTRARYCTHARIWIKYKHKQPLVKHHTLENFSLATDVSVGARFPQRCTCIAYTDIDTVYLVFLSSPPRLIFRSHCRGNPRVGAASSRHRSPNTKSAIKLGYWAVLRLFTFEYIFPPRILLRILLYSFGSSFFSISYPDPTLTQLFLSPWLRKLFTSVTVSTPMTVSLPLTLLVSEIC